MGLFHINAKQNERDNLNYCPTIEYGVDLKLFNDHWTKVSNWTEGKKLDGIGHSDGGTAEYFRDVDEVNAADCHLPNENHACHE